MIWEWKILTGADILRSTPHGSHERKGKRRYQNRYVVTFKGTQGVADWHTRMRYQCTAFRTFKYLYLCISVWFCDISVVDDDSQGSQESWSYSKWLDERTAQLV